MCSSYWYVNIAYNHLRFARIACNVSRYQDSWNLPMV